MKNKFGQNLSQIGALYDFYGQKNLGRQSSGIELSKFWVEVSVCRGSHRFPIFVLYITLKTAQRLLFNVEYHKKIRNL